MNGYIVSNLLPPYIPYIFFSRLPTADFYAAGPAAMPDYSQGSPHGRGRLSI
jgi:hypothetical protein